MKKRILLLTALALIFPTLCQAAEIKVTRNVEEGTYLISGIIDEARFNQMVLMDVRDYANNTKYIIEAETDNNGKFEQSIKLSDVPNGEYTLYIGAYDLKEPINVSLYYASSANVAIALREVNDALARHTDVIAALDRISTSITENKDSNAKILGLDNAYYTAMNAVEKSSIGAVLCRKNSYSDAEELHRTFYEALAVTVLRYATNDNASAVIKEFEDIYHFEKCEAYPLYESLYARNNGVVALMAGVAAGSIEEIQNIFNEKMVLEGIRRATTIGEAKDIYEDYSGLFDFKNYSGWTLDKIAQMTVGRTYASFQDMYQYLDENYKSDSSATIKPSNMGGGGSGGGGGKINPITTPSEIESVNSEVEGNWKIFQDLTNYQWAESAIEKLYRKDVVSGDGNGNFSPDREVTREEFVKMLLIAINMYTPGMECDFADVEKENWAYSYIACAYNLRIINGINENEFGLGEKITRQDMVTMLARAVEKADYVLDEVREYEGFSDENDISDYAKAAVELLYRAKIVNGFEDGQFKPETNATRAEAACIIGGLF